MEGEGSFGYYSQTLRASASQNEPWPLERLQERYGGSIARARGRRNHKWTLTGKAAHRLMLELRPYLSPRRQAQIDAAIEQRVGGKTNPRTLIL